MDENNNSVFEENPAPVQEGEAAPVDGKKPLDVVSLVLGIVALVFAAFVPLVTYACGIVGLVFAVKRRNDKRTKAALIICIVALVAGVVSNVISAVAIAKAASALLG